MNSKAVKRIRKAIRGHEVEIAMFGTNKDNFYKIAKKNYKKNKTYLL